MIGKDPKCFFCNLHSHLDDKFKLEVADCAKAIEVPDETDWFSLTLGWGIANGLAINPDGEDLNSAYGFALHIRYHTDLG
jgi:hypothetical protein